MPTTHVDSYTNDRLVPMYGPEENFRLSVKLADGTYAKGTVLGEVTASPGTYKAYNNANADGSQTARLILARACVVASGVITFNTSNGSGTNGFTQRTVDAYRGGTFKSTDLVGLDAAGVTDFGAKFLQGDLTSGIINIPG